MCTASTLCLGLYILADVHVGQFVVVYVLLLLVLFTSLFRLEWLLVLLVLWNMHDCGRG